MIRNPFRSFFRLPVIIGALPVTLANGTIADATQVMADLNFIVSQVNANAFPIGSPTTSQWQPLGQTPTFISATSFSVPGNLIGTFQSGLKLQTFNTGGTSYSYVLNSSFGAGVTTVNVIIVNGLNLDAGLNTVNFSILSTTPVTNSLPQKSIVQVLWIHNTDALVSGTGVVVATNNGFAVAGINYGGASGNFPISPGGTPEFSTATGQFVASRPGFYEVTQYVQVNTTGVTFSGICAVGPVSGAALVGAVNPDFCANLQANRASAVNSYVDYLSPGVCNLGLKMTFSAGTPVFVQGVFTVVGPL